MVNEERERDTITKRTNRYILYILLYDTVGIKIMAVRCCSRFVCLYV